jgi:hypothetical protein
MLENQLSWQLATPTIAVDRSSPWRANNCNFWRLRRVTAGGLLPGGSADVFSIGRLCSQSAAVYWQSPFLSGVALGCGFFTLVLQFQVSVVRDKPVGR